MRIPVLLLANHAQVTPNGLLDIAGGGWAHFDAQEFPVGVSGALCGLIELEGDADRSQPFVVEFSTRDHIGQSLGFSGSMVLSPTRGEGPGTVSFAVSFTLALDEPTLVEFVVMSAHMNPVALPLAVRHMPLPEA
jgi:hypothetical protein